jgi:hypothetical protein
MSTEENIELTPEAKALLRAEGGVESVPPGSSERVLGRLAGTLSLSPLAVSGLVQAPLPAPTPAPIPPVPPVAPGPLASWAAGGIKLKLLVTALALGAVVAVGVALRVSALSAPPEQPATPAATAASQLRSAVSAEPPPPGLAPTGSAATSAGGPMRSGVAPSSATSGAGAEPPSPSSLAEERGLLESARSALTAGNGQSALQTLSVHQRRFPRGRLVEERESLIVQATAHTAGPAAARQRLALFRRRFPKSIFLPALQAVVDSSR